MRLASSRPSVLPWLKVSVPRKRPKDIDIAVQQIYQPRCDLNRDYRYLASGRHAVTGHLNIVRRGFLAEFTGDGEKEPRA